MVWWHRGSGSVLWWHGGSGSVLWWHGGSGGGGGVVGWRQWWCGGMEAVVMVVG